jgi:hypothetical protein
VASEAQLPGHFGIGYQLEDIGGISPLRLAHYDNLLKLDPALQWSLLNVEYVYTQRAGVTGARPVERDSEGQLWKLDHPAPRAWLVGEARVLPDDGAAKQALEAGLDSGTGAVLAADPPFPFDTRAVEGKVSIETHSPERMVLMVDTPADGLLVVSENYYPGWTARVDGAPVEILRTDLSLRGVPIRAGVHHVEFEYDPWSVKLGIGISVLTLLICLGMLGWRRSRP